MPRIWGYPLSSGFVVVVDVTGAIANPAVVVVDEVCAAAELVEMTVLGGSPRFILSFAVVHCTG